MDEFASFILQIIPFYYFFKVCFLIWLYNPATQGAKKIYNGLFKPILKKYDKQIEGGLKVIKEVANEASFKIPKIIKVDKLDDCITP